MRRTLAKRVALLSDGRRGDDVVLALRAIAETGVVAPGSPAAELWAEAERQGFDEPEYRLLWCFVTATNGSVAEYVEEEFRCV